MSEAVGRILVVDDDRAVRGALRVNLSKAGHDVQLVENAQAALDVLRDRPFDLVLTDVMMPGMSGMELLAEVRGRWPEVQVVLMTGHGNVADAVKALKTGACDYIIKPVSKDELLFILAKALKEKALRAELVQLRAEVTERYGFENLIGTTRAMQEVYELVEAVAESTALVLLTGETGTGKEMLAHAIHYRSDRREGPFVGVNCAALPEGLLESELFGHEKGAFTGAVRQHLGRFEQADGGSILLDEIGEIPIPTCRSSSCASSRIGRVPAGRRNRDPRPRRRARDRRDQQGPGASEVKREGRFRKDLFYRLNVFQIDAAHPLPAGTPRTTSRCSWTTSCARTTPRRTDKPRRLGSARNAVDGHPRAPTTWPGNVRRARAPGRAQR